MQYYGTLYFGTPPKPFTTVFSTAEAWTWLIDISCGQDCHRASSAFDPSKSSTYEATNEVINVTAGTWVGHGLASLGKDTVSLSPYGDAILKQPFLLMFSSELHFLMADGYTVRIYAGFSLFPAVK